MCAEGNAMNTGQRHLTPNGTTVSAVGLGTWAIGGPSSAGSQPLGWGSGWDRDEAVRVVRAGFDAGITVFDTSDAYGTGSAQRIVGDRSWPTVRSEE